MSTCQSDCGIEKTCPASATLAGFAYLLGLVMLGVAWLGSYPDLSFGLLGQIVAPQGVLRNGTVFALSLAGLAVLAFARTHAQRSGPSPALLFPIFICGIIGFGVWGLALFEPGSVFPSPMSSGVKFAAFIIGWLAISGLTNASWIMSGRTQGQDEE